jgi:phosphate transport system substrate-binding protein
MQNKLVAALVVLFICSGIFPCGYAAAAGPIVLQSAGCKTEYFLLQDLAAAYSAKTGTKLQLGNTGNKKAVDLLRNKKIDFAFTCKTIEQLGRGLKLDQNAISGWISIPIAKDPIVVVANPKNGISRLSTQQLADIFQGKMKNWTEVGGSDLPVKTAYINPILESGVTLLFKEFTVGEAGNLDSQGWVGDNPSMLGNYVSMTPGGVTFMGFNSYQPKFGNILDIEGVIPTRENILNGTYKLAATYYLTLTGGENKDVADFLAFVRSEQGKEVIAKNFIPFSE